MKRIGNYAINNSVEDEDISTIQRRKIEQLISAIRATTGGSNTFFDLADFSWVSGVESKWPDIKMELDRLLTAIDLLPAFQEIQIEQNDISTDRRWRIFPLCAYGWWPQRNAQRCPITVETIKKIPGIQAAMFSILEPRKEIPPHLGPYCGVLRYHLGVKIPGSTDQCGIRVGKDTRHWQNGKSLIFDDTHDHQAWNRSNGERVVLFVDFERPLPDQLQSANQEVLSVIQDSEFIRNGVERWHEWERKYGSQIDQLLNIV